MAPEARADLQMTPMPKSGQAEQGEWMSQTSARPPSCQYLSFPILGLSPISTACVMFGVPGWWQANKIHGHLCLREDCEGCKRLTYWAYWYLILDLSPFSLFGRGGWLMRPQQVTVWSPTYLCFNQEGRPSRERIFTTLSTCFSEAGH